MSDNGITAGDADRARNNVPDTETPETVYDVFISYSHKDAEIYGADLIRTIKEEIEADLYDIACRRLVFLDSEALGYGDEWQAKIMEKIQECRVFICLLSENYLQSSYCTRERLWWERKEIQRGSLRRNTLPVYFIRLSECDPFQDKRPQVRDLVSFQMENVPWFDGGREDAKELYLRERIDNLKRAVRGKLLQAGAAGAGFNSVFPQPTRNFVGRILELKDLREICAGNRFPVIEGGAGVGKTELAAVYSYGYAGEYPQGRFLIHMEGVRSWREAVLSLVRNCETGESVQKELGISMDDMKGDEEALHKRIRDALFDRAKQGRLLLVLDNVDDASLFRERKLLEFSLKAPIPENIHMIATTRHELVFPGRSRAVAFPLGNLDDDASFELFCEIGENMFPFCRQPIIDKESDPEYNAVMEIIHLLDGHVWSLEILAGQMAEKYQDGATFQKKLETLNNNLSIQGDCFRHEAHDAVELLNPTLDLIRAMEHGDAIEQLVFFAALLPPEERKSDILEFCWSKYYAGLKFEDTDIDPFIHAYNQLWRYHLLKKADENEKMHRLTRAGLLKIMKENERYAETVRLLADALAVCPFLSHFSWVDLLELLPDMVKYLIDTRPTFLSALLSPDDWVRFLTKDESFLEICPEKMLQSMTGTNWTGLLVEHPRFADKCPWEKLADNNWAYLLYCEPRFADRCPWDRLGGNAWRDLLSGAPQFADRCLWEKLDSEDWCGLLIEQPQFADKCPWDQFDASTWEDLLCWQPQFADQCPWDKLSGNNWTDLLQKQPQFADRCPWDKLTGSDWTALLKEQPQFADKCQWGKLNNFDWRWLLEEHPQFADKCPWEKLDGGDLAGLLGKQPQLADKCPWKKISVNEWGDLLRDQPRFADKCPWEKLENELDSFSWRWLLEEHPQFAGKCPWEKLDGGDWAGLLGGQPQFADQCPWEKLDGGNWAGLLGRQPQFADKCPWDKLSGEDWAWLLSEQPRFSDRCPWDKLTSEDWANLLSSQPQFADKCPWEKLDGGDWAGLLGCQPQFADQCPWEKLDGGDWAGLLERQPQFADKCPWEKLEGKDWVNILNVDLPFHMPWERTAEECFADKCPWDKLTGEDWTNLLYMVPKYADRCPWDKLSGENWCDLLGMMFALTPGEDSMRIAEHCPWDTLTGEELTDILSWSPQFADKCPWEKLDGGDWAGLLERQPQFADRCPWDKLSVEDWSFLLEKSPQFADQCPFKDLVGDMPGPSDEDDEDMPDDGEALPEMPGFFDEDDESKPDEE